MGTEAEKADKRTAIYEVLRPAFTAMLDTATEKEIAARVTLASKAVEKERKK